MQTIKVETTSEHLKKIAKETPIRALSELVWNGFDAKATNINISFKSSELGGIDEILVIDNGGGIPYEKINKLFGSLGGSWKKNAKKMQGNEYLHGENGQGRFKAFSLGEKVVWTSIDKKIGCFDIKSSANNLLTFDVENSTKTLNNGTMVSVSNISKDSFSLLRNSDFKLAEIFFLYLSKYKNKKLYLNNELISPELVQECVTEINLGDCIISDELTIQIKLSIVEWKNNIKTGKQINYCCLNGFTLYEEKIDKKFDAVDCKFTVFAESNYFLTCHDNNQLSQIEISNELRTIRDIIVDSTRNHFLEKDKLNRARVVNNWIDEDIYPYDEKKYLDPTREAERKVFDILAVNVQTYLKKFNKSDKKTKKFTFKLLRQAIEANPNSVQKIINEVLGLTITEQQDLADLLERTTLSSIISSSNIVANRIDFLNGLERQLFSDDSKKKTLERDHLHKMLDEESWIFKEEFYLAGSEMWLEQLLEKHLDILDKGDEFNPEDIVELPDGRRGRIDLMLSKVRKPSDDITEILVVELKRPNKKIDDKVLSQIEKYAMAVSEHESFNHDKVKWIFVAISNSMDKYAKKKVNQRGKAKGLLYDDAEYNVEVWVHTWAEVIGNARARLNFFSEQLKYQASMDSADRYLKKMHEKHIPILD